MLSDEQIRELVSDAGLDWHEGYDSDREINLYAALARLVERHVLAKPHRILRELEITIDDYMRWSEEC